jgi:hypothetical protein
MVMSRIPHCAREHALRTQECDFPLHMIACLYATEIFGTNATVFVSGRLGPCGILTIATAATQLVELKNGETYNGILVNCDIWMNLSLRDVVCTSRVSTRCRRYMAFSHLLS